VYEPDKVRSALSAQARMRSTRDIGHLEERVLSFGNHYPRSRHTRLTRYRLRAGTLLAPGLAR
jgi:hypothetical protein